MKIDVNDYRVSQSRLLELIYEGNEPQKDFFTRVLNIADTLGLPPLVALYYLGDKIGFAWPILDRMWEIDTDYKSILKNTSKEFKWRSLSNDRARENHLKTKGVME